MNAGMLYGCDTCSDKQKELLKSVVLASQLINIILHFCIITIGIINEYKHTMLLGALRWPQGPRADTYALGQNYVNSSNSDHKSVFRASHFCLFESKRAQSHFYPLTIRRFHIVTNAGCKHSCMFYLKILKYYQQITQTIPFSLSLFFFIYKNTGGI